MSINSWCQITEKEKYNNNSRFRLSELKLGRLFNWKGIICVRLLFSYFCSHFPNNKIYYTLHRMQL